MRWPVVLLLVLLAGCGGGDEGAQRSAGTPARTAQQALAPVEPGARAVQHLEELARLTERAGGDRVASTDGEHAAADYAVGVLRAAGFTVRTEDVRFPFFEERRQARVTVGGQRAGSGAEIETLAYSPAGDARGRLVAVAPDRPDSGCRASDYEVVRRGQVVLAGRGVCPFAGKARLAARAGAAAIVVADQGSDGAPQGTLGRPGVVRIPAVAVGRAAGQRLREAADAGRTARVVTSTVSETRTSRNVIADAQRNGSDPLRNGSDPRRGAQRNGSDPRRGGRVVMVGGHLDSVPGAPGVNDNATGIAASLAAAETLARERVPVRVGLWGAEELGLYGSRAHVRRLSTPERRALRAYVNLDMVGSPNAVPFFYGQGPEDAARRLRSTLRDALEDQRERPERSQLGGGSDHAPFARAGIAAGGIFTGAEERMTAQQARRHDGRAGRPLDPCYHRPCDDLGNVDRTTLRRSARAATAALRDLARG